jgi:hypothetical protein
MAMSHASPRLTNSPIVLKAKVLAEKIYTGTASITFLFGKKML